MSPDQPVYALKSRGLEGREEFETIEDMARHYVSELRAFQPGGPYLLGGYCFGGVVAYEMARQLETQSQTVALLALINSGPPNSNYTQYRRTPVWACKFAFNLGRIIAKSVCQPPEQRRKFVAWKAQVLKERIQQFLRPAPPESAAAKAGELVDLSDYSEDQRKLWAVHLRALSQYHPQPYSGHVTLFRGSIQMLFCSFDRAYGWGGLALGGVTVRIIPGAHEKIIEEPRAERLAGELESCLTRAQENLRPHLV